MKPAWNSNPVVVATPNAVSVQANDPPPAPVASSPSQRAAEPVMVAQTGVSTPAVFTNPEPSKLVKFCPLIFKAPAEIVNPPLVTIPAPSRKSIPELKEEVAPVPPTFIKF